MQFFWPWDLSPVLERLNRMEVRLAAELLNLRKGVEKMSAQLDALTAEVTRNTTVDESAITLLQGLAAQIEAMKTDPAALQGLADSLRSSSDALAAAVVANTPAA